MPRSAQKDLSEDMNPSGENRRNRSPQEPSSADAAPMAATTPANAARRTHQTDLAKADQRHSGHKRPARPRTQLWQKDDRKEREHTGHWEQQSGAYRAPRHPARSSPQEQMYSPPQDHPYHRTMELYSSSTRSRHHAYLHEAAAYPTEGDVEQREDDIGPDVADCLNLGSFGDESPPRGPSPRDDPAYASHSYYRKSPRPPPYASPYEHGAAYYAPPGHPHMYPPYPGAYPHYYAHYPPPTREHHWTSPPAESPYGAPYHPPPEEAKYDETPTSRPLPETPPKEEPADETPHVRSPFRSPPRNSGKPVHRKSPSPYQASPHIANYGSFGMMDTPGTSGPLAAEFSPMGPSFESLGQDSMAMPIGEGFESKPFDPRPPGRTPIQQRQHPAASPFGKYMNEFSPLQSGIHGVARSPVTLERRPSSAEKERRSIVPSPPSGYKRTQISSSPIGRGSEAKPRKLWNDMVTPSPGPVRLELGDVGSRSSATRKSLEGINSMMRAQSGHPTPSRPGYVSGIPQNPTPHRRYHPELSTPIKMPGRPSPSIGSSSHRLGAMQSPGLASAINKFSSGKENRTTPSALPRSHCNCKKSKCLKLYCECFAAELFCDGCKCIDCRNGPQYGPERAKAVKETRAKNPNAFKPRITVKSVSTAGSSPQSGHNMGCRCKKSECLKKYCECFQAGVMCGDKCKCVDCLNYAGSQALIDKRRKIKDHRGADFAMRVADEAWKGQPVSRKVTATPAAHRMGAHLASPASVRLPGRGGYPQPSPQPGVGGPPSADRGPHSYVAHSHHMMGHPHLASMGYSPMGAPPVTPGYSQRVKDEGRAIPPSKTESSKRECRPKVSTVTPRTPAVRAKFDLNSSRKRRKLNPGVEEETYPYFGTLPEQPKTTMLAIFSCLTNDDIYNAGLVNKKWSQLAMDEELWKFQT